MSPRAAWRLETLGFEEVFDYAAGKQDWLAFGLPVEGKLGDVPTIGPSADRDAPTCSLTERVGDVKQRVRDASAEACVVTNKEGIVLGLIKERLWEANPELSVEEIMECGPTTVRPHLSLDRVAEYMRKNATTTALVTTPDGRFVGLVKGRE